MHQPPAERFVAPHFVRISGRDPYKENSTINGLLDMLADVQFTTRSPRIPRARAVYDVSSVTSSCHELLGTRSCVPADFLDCRVCSLDNTGDYELVKIVEGKPAYKKVRRTFIHFLCKLMSPARQFFNLMLTSIDDSGI